MNKSLEASKLTNELEETRAMREAAEAAVATLTTANAKLRGELIEMGASYEATRADLMGQVERLTREKRNLVSELEAQGSHLQELREIEVSQLRGSLEEVKMRGTLDALHLQEQLAAANAERESDASSTGTLRCKWTNAALARCAEPTPQSDSAIDTCAWRRWATGTAMLCARWGSRRRSRRRRYSGATLPRLKASRTTPSAPPPPTTTARNALCARAIAAATSIAAGTIATQATPGRGRTPSSPRSGTRRQSSKTITMRSSRRGV